MLDLPHKVPHLFLGPCFYHFPGITPAVSMSETVVTLYITISVPIIVQNKKLNSCQEKKNENTSLNNGVQPQNKLINKQKVHLNILKYQNRSFVYFDCQLLTISFDCMINICLLGKGKEN